MRKEPYTKLFQRILNSSIWDENDSTRIVWITLLALAGEDGTVIGTISAITRHARVSTAQTVEALEKFERPDPESLTSEHEGRRIERIEGGWRLLNHTKYKKLMSLEHRREYFRLKKQESRERERELTKGLSAREIINQRARDNDQMHDQPTPEPFHT